MGDGVRRRFTSFGTQARLEFHLFIIQSLITSIPIPVQFWTPTYEIELTKIDGLWLVDRGHAKDEARESRWICCAEMLVLLFPNVGHRSRGHPLHRHLGQGQGRGDMVGDHSHHTGRCTPVDAEALDLRPR